MRVKDGEGIETHVEDDEGGTRVEDSNGDGMRVEDDGGGTRVDEDDGQTRAENTDSMERSKDAEDDDCVREVQKRNNSLHTRPARRSIRCFGQ